jgi:hypothetical protein
MSLVVGPVQPDAQFPKWVVPVTVSNLPQGTTSLKLTLIGATHAKFSQASLASCAVSGSTITCPTTGTELSTTITIQMPPGQGIASVQISATAGSETRTSAIFVLDPKSRQSEAAEPTEEGSLTGHGGETNNAGLVQTLWSTLPRMP